jgi:hypothetical protein
LNEGRQGVIGDRALLKAIFDGVDSLLGIRFDLGGYHSALFRHQRGVSPEGQRGPRYDDQQQY